MNIFEKYQIPTYDFSGGKTFCDAGDGCELITVADAKKEDLQAYADLLKSEGFTENTPAREAAGNLFFSFSKGGCFVYAYYTEFYKTVKLIAGPIETLFAPDGSQPEEKYQAEMMIVGQDLSIDCGLGMVYLLPNGKFIAQDSGCVYPNKPDYMYKTMKMLAPDPENITVAAWFITHPHEDHQDEAVAFIKAHADEVKIENMIFNYYHSERFDIDRTDGCKERSSHAAKALREACEFIKEKQGTKIVKAHTGEIYNFGSTQAEVIYTGEDFLPKQVQYNNSTSLVIRLTVAGTSAMLLADTTHESGKIIKNMWGDYLKSDMVQMAHHGMWASYASLYDRIQGKAIIWNNRKAIIKSNKIMGGGEAVQLEPINAALGYATDVYFAEVDGVRLKLPLVYQNNKTEAME